MTVYREAAERTASWLVREAQRSSDGWYWYEKPGMSEVEAGVGWGTGGPPLFFVELFRTSGDERWLGPALEAERWMASHLEGLSRLWAGCGLFTGVGGWVVIAEELAAATGDEGHRELARRTLELIISRANQDEDGLHWHGYTEILWGTAGIGCLLLQQGRAILGDAAVDLAVRAGDWLLAQAEPAPTGGIYWSLGPAYQAEHPGRVRHIPGFAHGAAGIGFFLARLAQIADEERFAEGARQAADWIITTARSEGGVFHPYHHDIDGQEEFSLGWCYGPAGIGWFFRQMEITDGHSQWRDFIRRAAVADATSGIPERRQPGFWDNVARCCGSAGVAEWFLDLHRYDNNDQDLAFAIVMVEDLINRAINDDRGMRWSNYEHRNENPDLPPEPTYLQGASGIGSTLCRLDRHLRGDKWTVNWPHAPTWGDGLTTGPTEAAGRPSGVPSWLDARLGRTSMFRRKGTQKDPTGESARGSAPRVGAFQPVPQVNALQSVYTRVLQSFLVEGTASPPAPPVSAPGGSFSSPPPSPPFDAGPMAPPPVNAPGAAFVGPLIGPEGSMGSMPMGAPSLSVNIPGSGAVSRQQMETAEARAQAAIQEALGSADLSHLTPPDVQAVQGRLEAMRAGGRLTDEQHAALSEGLAVLSQFAAR